MCGRYTNHATWEEVHAFSQPLVLPMPPAEIEPAYNVAPTQMAWVILPNEISQMKWGLIPAWSKEVKFSFSTINARLDTISTLRSYKNAWRAGRRCLVIASGYYEWPVIDRVKRPHYIHRTDSPVTLFGGIWEPRGDLRTFSIVTKDADENIAQLHDRMPLILPPELLGDWLRGSTDDAMGIAMTLPEQPMAFYEVGKAVGNVRNQGPALIEPVAA